MVILTTQSLLLLLLLTLRLSDLVSVLLQALYQVMAAALHELFGCSRGFCIFVLSVCIHIHISRAINVIANVLVHQQPQ